MAKAPKPYIFDDLKQVADETQRVDALYAHLFKEENRLSRSQAARVEYLTTMRAIDRVLKPGCRVLDLGAGTGAYSLPLARRGHSVTAIELALAFVPGAGVSWRQQPSAV